MTKVKRVDQFNPLEKQALSYVWHEVQEVPKDGKWRTFKGRMKYRDQYFFVQMDFRHNGEYLSVADMCVEHDQQLLVLPQSLH